MEVYLEHVAKAMSEITQTINTLKKSKTYDEVLVAHLQEVHRTLVYSCRDIGEQRHHYFFWETGKRAYDVRRGGMTTKYGIRHYTEIGAYLAFKDTVFLGVVIKREWLALNGSILRNKDVVGKAMGLSREEAMESIRNHINIATPNNGEIDEYVYKEEWWEK